MSLQHNHSRRRLFIHMLETHLLRNVPHLTRIYALTEGTTEIGDRILRTPKMNVLKILSIGTPDFLRM